MRANLNIENASIGYRNFAGRETDFNEKGRRNFSVFFDADTAEELMAEGWNVRRVKSSPDDDPTYFMKVAVRYDTVPPTIYLVDPTTKKKRVMSEDSIANLDRAEFENIDLTITPYDWERNGRSGRKAYLKTMYVTLKRDTIDRKYAEYDEYSRTSDDD